MHINSRVSVCVCVCVVGSVNVLVTVLCLKSKRGEDVLFYSQAPEIRTLHKRSFGNKAFYFLWKSLMMDTFWPVLRMNWVGVRACCCSLFLCRTHFLSLSPSHSRWFGWLRRLAGEVWRRSVSSHCRISTSWTFVRASSKMLFSVSAGRSKNGRCSGPPSCSHLTSSEYLHIFICPKTPLISHWHPIPSILVKK